MKIRNNKFNCVLCDDATIALDNDVRELRKRWLQEDHVQGGGVGSGGVVCRLR